MVKKSLFIVFSALIVTVTFSTLLSAAEFTAHVNNTQVYLNDSFPLILTLKDGSPKETPSLSSLNNHFFIHSQQYSTNTTIINRKMSSSITWKIFLTPKTEGVIEIPSITVDTEEGVLSTQPITLKVSKGSAQQSHDDDTGLNISAKVNNASPYKNESIIYTASLTSKTSLYNVKVQKIQVQDAIVELIGEPKLEEKFIDGTLFNVVDFTYLITPLKTGSLKIPAMVIQGDIPQTRKEQFNTYSHDDLFSIMQGLDRLKPFSLISEDIQLDVQPAISGVSPWLPARTLILEEQWPNHQTLRAGEPITRGFVIKAEGVKASQLPHLEDLQAPQLGFKIYADKPEEQEKISDGIIHSLRKEQYTLIPQQGGTLVLPEISISWWDSVKKEKKTSTIPARTVQILPAVETAATIPSEIKIQNSAETPVPSTNSSYILYSIIGILIFLFIAALLWGIALQRKIASLTEGPTQKPIKQPAANPKKTIPQLNDAVQNDKKEKLPDLNPT